MITTAALMEENSQLRAKCALLTKELRKTRSLSVIRLQRIEYAQAHLKYEMSIIPDHTQHWALLKSALDSLDV